MSEQAGNIGGSLHIRAILGGKMDQTDEYTEDEQEPFVHGAVTAFERAEEMCRQIARGRSQASLAQEYGISRQRVSKIVRDHMKRRPAPGADAIRANHAMQLEEAAKLAWATAEESMGELRLKALDRVVRILERHARLMGIDAPSKVQAEVTHFNGDSELDREIDRLMAYMGRMEQSKAALEADGPPQPTDPRG